MKPAPAIPGIVMVDDNALAAEAMRRRFTRSGELRWIGWTDDPGAVDAMIDHQGPCIVLLDVEMPGSDSYQLLRRLSRLFPSIPIVMFSGHDNPAFVERALAEGAAGYIHKDESTTTISDLLQRAARGECVLSPLAAKSYMRAARSE